MWRPFKRKVIESRDTSWSDAIAQLQHYRATGSLPSGKNLGSKESAVGLFSRCFMSAKIHAGPMVQKALTPFILSSMVRDLLSEGEAVYQIVVGRGGLRLARVYLSNVYGQDDDETTWTYETHRASPTGTTRVERVPSSDIIHIRYSADPLTPWQGRSPLSRSRDLERGASNLEVRLGDELSQAAGSLLPLPVGSLKREALQGLARTVQRLKGGPGVVESPDSGYGSGTRHDRGAGQRGLRKVRLGAEPPGELIDLINLYGILIGQTHGIPAEMARADASSAAGREAWRRFHHSAVVPVARLMEFELSAKLEEPVTIDLSMLGAADIMSRARSYATLRKAEMPDQDARHFAGLE